MKPELDRGWRQRQEKACFKFAPAKRSDTILYLVETLCFGFKSIRLEKAPVDPKLLDCRKKIGNGTQQRLGALKIGGFQWLN
jgi:hypothetical protein